MKARINQIIGLIFVSILLTSCATKKLTTGAIEYGFQAKGEGMMGGMSEMFEAMTQTYTFSKSISKLDMKMPMGIANITTFTKADGGEPTIFFEGMGQKYKIKGTVDKLLGGATGSTENTASIKSISYYKETEKDIAGYPCYKAQVNMSDGNKLELWVTEKIGGLPPTMIGGDELASALKGFPMQMNTQLMGMEVVLIAKSVATEISSNSFSMPSGFNEITVEEFLEKMSSLGM